MRAAFARQLVDELLPQHPGYYGDMVWILMMLEQWLRSHDAGSGMTKSAQGASR